MITMYELLRQSEKMEENGVDIADLYFELLEKEEDAQDFIKSYKTFYSDIKTSIKEDW